MLSIGKTLCWEFWRENRAWWLCIVGALVAVCLLEFAADEPAWPAGELPAIAFFVLLFVEIVVVSFCLLKTQYNGQNQRLGFPAHLYTRPVSTFQLVIWRLSLALFTSMAFHGVVALTFKLPGNMAVPMLVVGLTVTWAHALMWLFPNIRWLQTICVGLALVPYFALGSRVEDFYATSVTDLMRRVSLPASLVALAVAYGVAWVGVNLDRQNVSLDPMRLLGQCRRFTGPLSLASFTPQSPFKTLFLFEMRRKGWQLPVGISVTFFALLSFWLFDVISIEFFSIYVELTFYIGTLSIPFLIGIFIGKRGKGDLKIESYQAVKPVTNNELLRIYLFVALAMFALAWGSLMGGPLLLSLLVLVTGQTDFLAEFWEPVRQTYQSFSGTRVGGFLWLGLLIGSWTILTLSATLMLTGRRWLTITVWLAIFLSPSILKVFLRLCLPLSLHPITLETILSIVALACLTGSFVAYRQAHRCALVSTPLIVVAGGLYGLLVMVALLAWEWDAFSLLICLALLSLPLLPIAAAPLALDWNRHR